MTVTRVNRDQLLDMLRQYGVELVGDDSFLTDIDIDDDVIVAQNPLQPYVLYLINISLNRMYKLMAVGDVILSERVMDYNIISSALYDKLFFN